MSIEDDITKVLAEWHAEPADPEAWQFAMFEDATARIMPLVKRAQAEAWGAARRSVQALPHWYNTDDGYGEFDLQPLGPDETSEQGAFMAVREVLARNPYADNEGAGA